MPADNPLALSDEEFLAQAAPPVVEKTDDAPPKETNNEQDPPVTPEEPKTPEHQDPAEGDPTPDGEVDKNPPEAIEKKSEVEETPKPKEPSTPNPESKETPPKNGEPEDKGNGAKAQPPKKEGDQDPDKKQPEAEAPNYEEFFKTVMAPLRANGKTIQLKTPQEAIQLMQQGANYTLNMQRIRHHKKSLMMLEQNGLLDESKISYLIDLSKGDPSAIQKLLKEKQVDPLDIDTRGDSTYQDNGNHRLSDAEVNFTSQLEDLGSTPEGVETIRSIQGWDQASKEFLWNNPQVMSFIHEQRSNGTYEIVANEVDRRRSIGIIGANVPFIEAYHQIGTELTEQAKQKQQPAPVQPVATRVATPKPVVANNDKANAAAPTRNTPHRTEAVKNPLSMSDEEFEQNFAQWRNRL